MLAAVLLSRPVFGRVDRLASLNGAIAGLVAIGVAVFGASLFVWRVLDATVGARISPRVERLGQDAAELGIESFPEFRLVDED